MKTFILITICIAFQYALYSIMKKRITENARQAAEDEQEREALDLIITEKKERIRKLETLGHRNTKEPSRMSFEECIKFNTVSYVMHTIKDNNLIQDSKKEIVAISEVDDYVFSDAFDTEIENILENSSSLETIDLEIKKISSKAIENMYVKYS